MVWIINHALVCNICLLCLYVELPSVNTCNRHDHACSMPACFFFFFKTKILACYSAMFHGTLFSFLFPFFLKKKLWSFKPYVFIFPICFIFSSDSSFILISTCFFSFAYFLTDSCMLIVRLFKTCNF